MKRIINKIIIATLSVLIVFIIFLTTPTTISYSSEAIMPECNAEIPVMASVIDRENKEAEKQIINKLITKLNEENKIRAEQAEQKRIEEERQAEEKRKEEERKNQEEIKRIEEEQEQTTTSMQPTETTKPNNETIDKGTIVSGIPINNAQTYVNELSATDKNIAYKIINAIDNNENSITFENETFNHIMYIVQSVQDTYFYAYLDSELSVKEYTNNDVEVFMSKNTKSNYDKCKTVSNEIQRVGNTLKGLTERKAVEKLNNYIVNTFVYEENTRNLYSLVTSHIGNCDSYSQFFEYVCDYVGVQCNSVTGYIVNTGEHEWNRVRVDGVWYYIDTTFNKTYNNEYFLSTSIWGDTHTIYNEYKRSEANDE